MCSASARSLPLSMGRDSQVAALCRGFQGLGGSMLTYMRGEMVFEIGHPRMTYHTFCNLPTPSAAQTTFLLRHFSGPCGCCCPGKCPARAAAVYRKSCLLALSIHTEPCVADLLMRAQAREVHEAWPAYGSLSSLHPHPTPVNPNFQWRLTSVPVGTGAICAHVSSLTGLHALRSTELQEGNKR